MIELEDVTAVGTGLKRPECVLCTAGGALFTADWDGGVTRIDADGTQQQFLAPAVAAMRPNGIALCPDGSFLLAHLGDADGGVFRLFRDGTLEPLLTEVDGAPLPPTNFILPDRDGRFWITVSTRLRPRDRDYRPDAADGFIVLLDGDGARIVADGLGYTNEVQVHPSGDWLYVNETFGRRLSRFPINAGGALGARETVTAFGHGSFPDGMAFDAEGQVWIVSIVSNRVVRVDDRGNQETVLEDKDDAHLDWVEQAYLAGELGRPHLDGVKSRKLRNISSLAFGGSDLRTVYLGCLLGDQIARFRAPVAGHPPAHWRYEA